MCTLSLHSQIPSIQTTELKKLEFNKANETPSEPIQLKSLELSKDEVSLTDMKNGSVPTSINLTETESLPEVRINKDGRFTHSFNNFGMTINELDMGNARNFSVSLKSDLAIILKSNDNKRDVLVFSNMSDNVKKNSSIPNKYYHIEGTGTSKISFDKDHNIVIDLKNKERIVIEGKEPNRVLEGPFSINFKPENIGDNFASDIKYTGKSPLKSFTSKGDKINW